MVRNNSKSIISNVFFSILKQGCSVLFPLITFVYASHKLGTANIGRYSFSQSIISYLSLIAMLGITTYGVREGAFLRDKKEEFEGFVNELFSINLIMTIMSYVIMIGILLIWKNVEPYRLIIAVSSLSIIITTMGMDWINSVYEDFRYLAVRYFVVQVVALLLLFVFVRDESDLLPYTIISLLACSGGELFNIFHIKKYVRLRFTFHMNFRKHIIPLIILFSSNLAVIIYVNSDITLITLYLGDDSAGIYAAATKIYQAIKHLIFAVITVMIPRFSYLVAQKNESDRDDLLEKTLTFLTFITIPMIAGLCVEAKNIIYVFSGVEYLSGTYPLIVLSFAIVFAVSSNIFNCAILLPYRKERTVLVLTIVACCTNVLLNIVFVPYFGIFGAAITTLISEAINGIGSWFFGRKKCKIHLNKWDILSELIAMLAFLPLCTLINIIIDRTVLRLFFAVVSSTVTYIVLLYILKNRTVKNITEFLINKVRR